MHKYRIIVAGSRDFMDYEWLTIKLDQLFLNMEPKDVEIICGMARGADRLGRLYAHDNGIKVNEMPANWSKYGKSAGYIRNEEMAKRATHCICFWDGKSKGTKHMIDLANKYDLDIRIIRI